ncbi:non-ribosomal peptide synthetase [Acuticoccus kandeliae]|uniref:non-ribosomal peptide synthetase n=1 Tax=Acuticoccus kandeliae TaxID=2073160 RepID=UPI000D3E925E|nr:non-ribosomal peptide synthetase [Acuticoccus kandeliae]
MADLSPPATFERTAARTPGDFVSAIAAREPHRLAIVDGARHVSYGELDALADRVAAAVASRLGPARRDRIVALSMPPGFGTVAAMLGIMKAGACYLPIDPEQPQSRIDFVLADSGAALLIEDGALGGAYEGERIALADALAFEGEAAPHAADPADAAYAIYTSGSTGTPKGVVIENRNAVNLIHGCLDRVGFSGEDRGLAFASISFDAAIWETFGILSCGGALVIVAPEVRRNPAALVDLMARERVSLATLPPALLPKLPDVPLPNLRLLVTAGDTCSADDVARWSAGRQMLNGYGPTEASVCAACADLTPETPATLIGSAMPGATLYVLSESGEPVGVGGEGELYIGGAGVSRGYLNRPELTAARFLTGPAFPGDRVFRTGDRVRVTAPGIFTFLGRIDNQVKISGHRVELDEVGRAMERVEGVAQACVIAFGEDNARRLVAFYVPTGEPVAPARLTEALMAWLPAAMLPSETIPLADLPLTVSGKFDRTALAALAAREAADAAARPAATGAMTGTEAEIGALWCQLLKVPSVAPSDSFFALGGDSLRLSELLVTVNERYGTTLMPARFRKLPDLAALAAFVDSRRKSGPAA